MIKDSHYIQRTIESFPFLRQGGEEFQRLFFRSATLVRLEQETTICGEGSQCSALSLILSGTARVFKLGESGREITLYRIGSGESCILTAACIVNDQPFPAFAVSEQPLEAVAVSARNVRLWMDQSPDLRRYLFRLISDRLGDVIAVVEEVAFKRIDRRLANFLLMRAGVRGERVVNATHQEIASDLGTSREVVSRVLKDLETRGYLSVSRGAVRITDVIGLQNKAESR